ncbi:response regulator [Anaerosacchariphilus polymeriproducens]|uniref:Stage 0 sporulation protein A homolog n=1 Tax=Anaerosacchariphilus polymeriproducens TaxID=1812858 RepID=A0A371ASM3_9FIRM|nr:response regulator [Anaerosacchariphilus polymeriproducens]RDU22568.1 response regulator [Anaerosacchariphilus polymeriproducens]
MYEKYSVLFVDDEVYILNSLRRGFMDEEYQCYFANSGKQAIDIMEENEIHLIVTDMKMPIMTGLDLLNIVEKKWPRTVKIILTGYTQLPQILATINQVDIFKFVTKPWLLEELNRFIRKGLDYYILKEQNLEYQELLEKKNESYQNILKRMDFLIEDAKKRCQILGSCGKAIYGFQKRYSLRDRITFQNVFSVEEEIYEMICNAVVMEKKKCSAKELKILCQETIESIFEETTLECADDLNGNYEINVDMFKTAVLIILLIFEEEFRMSGIFGKIKCENKFKLSIISPKIQTIEEKSADDITSLDVKVEFAQCIISEILSQIPFKFQIIIAEGSLVIGFSLDNATIT